MATAPRTYTATTPAGRVVTRTTRSDRLHYTHIRVIKVADQEAITWHTSEELARHGRSDIDPQRKREWIVVPCYLVGGKPAPAKQEQVPVEKIDQEAAAKLGGKLVTIGRSKTAHLAYVDADGHLYTDCRASTWNQQAYGPSRWSDEVTCKTCIRSAAKRTR